MVIKVQNETPFQVLSDSFTIGPSETGYELQVGATSQDFSTLFSVGANTPRMVTNVANGSYYRLKGNSGEVSVNWQRTCKGGGGEGGSNTELNPVMDFPVAPAAGTVVAYAGSSSAAGVYQYNGTDWIPVGVDDLSAYWTSAQTQSAITAVEDHLFDVEQVTASALTELHDGLLEVSARTIPDMSLYTPTSGFATVNGSAITEGGDIVIEPERLKQSDYFDDPENGVVISTPVSNVVEWDDSDLQRIDGTVDKYFPGGSDINEIYCNRIIARFLDDSILTIRKNRNDDYFTLKLWENAAKIKNDEYAKEVPEDGETNWVFCDEDDICHAYIIRFYHEDQEDPTTPLHIIIETRDTNDVPTDFLGELITVPFGGVSVYSDDYGWLDLYNRNNIENATGDMEKLRQQVNEMDYVIAQSLNDLNERKVSSSSIKEIWKGTQSEYDTLTQSGATADPNTFYIIVNN